MSRRRKAGVSVPLFSLRSRRSWGIGEIGDIPAVAGWLRSAHQSVLQILPMNEMSPAETSPYSALSAMAIDPQYVSIWMLAAAPILEAIWSREIEEARRAQRIDYARVRSLKDRALKACFDRFYDTDWLPGTPKADALRSYVTQEGWWINEYSLYRAIRAREGERPWTEWPPTLRDREAPALVKASGELAREILYYKYVQWVAADQWQAARTGAQGIEILGDLPFTVALDSADVWSRRDEFLLDASVGTPPDAFSAVGQEWGLPPYNWEEARKNDFAWIRMRARRLAELYDGFRIDHLVGFYRTYVRPSAGGPPYFSPPSEDEQVALGEAVMRIMIETGADISAEDLGVVPDFVRASIARLGLPGYRVLRWEPEDPSTYPERSVAMTSTHDTEPVAMWWESLAPDEQHAFGLESPAFTPLIRDTLIQRMYDAGSDLVLLPIQDVFGWRDRINQPATVSDVNWTYALPWPVDEMPDHHQASECAERLAEWSDRTGRWAPGTEAGD
ncbi:MAG: 4-alpha-glucanotransferase [Acidobacteria bacterium]|nr:4-alpha-glucanotransferase [Acidobacteriota bacterium]